MFSCALESGQTPRRWNWKNGLGSSLQGLEGHDYQSLATFSFPRVTQLDCIPPASPAVKSDHVTQCWPTEGSRSDVMCTTSRPGLHPTSSGRDWASIQGFLPGHTLSASLDGNTHGKLGAHHGDNRTSTNVILG